MDIFGCQRIDWTNFTYIKSSYCSGFKALTELSIDGKIISTNFLYSFGMLPSLRKLLVCDITRLTKTIGATFFLAGRHQEPYKLEVRSLQPVHDNSFIHWQSQILDTTSNLL
jgi:hypothetical protein